MPKFTVGCDPEIFVKDRLIKMGMSAAGLVPGTKAYPYAVTGGAVQVDGMALEINIDPASTRAEFLDRIRTVMQDLSGMVPDHMELDLGNPFMEFDPDFLLAQPPEAIELGCEPDYNAYTGRVNPRPNGKVNFRTAAGHIHIGWEAGVPDPYRDRQHFALCREMAKQLDYYVGIWSLLWDPDDRRRSLYGKAGAFRAKSYGLEYRTPSTAWLADPALQAWVFDASMKAVEDFFKGDKVADLWGEEARTIIDNNDLNWQSRVDFDLDLSLPYQRAA